MNYGRFVTLYRRHGFDSWSGKIPHAAATATAKSLQSCLTLCDPIDGSPPGSPIPRILQARTLEWGCHFLFQCTKVKSQSEVAQSCPTLSDPMDCSLPGSSVHGIFQAKEYYSRRILRSNVDLNILLILRSSV